MKKIKMIQKKNTEDKTLTTLYLGEEEFNLSDKELGILLQEFFNSRGDVFSEFIQTKELSQVEELEDKIEELEDRINELEEDDDCYDDDD